MVKAVNLRLSRKHKVLLRSIVIVGASFAILRCGDLILHPSSLPLGSTTETKDSIPLGRVVDDKSSSSHQNAEFFVAKAATADRNFLDSDEDHEHPRAIEDGEFFREGTDEREFDEESETDNRGESLATEKDGKNNTDSAPTSDFVVHTDVEKEPQRPSREQSSKAEPKDRALTRPTRSSTHNATSKSHHRHHSKTTTKRQPKTSSSHNATNESRHHHSKTTTQRHRPFFLYGKFDYLKGPRDPRKKLIRRLYHESYKPIVGPNVTTWALPSLLKHPTRNHDSVVLEGGDDHDRPILMTLLGRYSRYIQSMDLLTGKQQARRTKGKDPSGNDLDDLNHVTAVLVDSLDRHGRVSGKKEIWLPCGFHNDEVNKETSTDYVRIVDAETMKVRVGPKLPIAGGACISKALPIIPNEPPMICTFAGTQGHHDHGTFLRFTQCYDRKRERWWTPFGNLPYGLDHGSLAVIPAGTCHRRDPARVLIFNFRTRPYGTPHPEFLAHDIPMEGWTLKTLKRYDDKTPEKWYVYHNVTDTRLLKDTPRDASGVVMADNGRLILNFGGTYRTKRAHIRGKSKQSTRGRTSMIRAFDVCRKEWNVAGDLGLKTFALQSAASDTLGVAITCGGEAPLMNTNSPFCFVSRWSNLTVSNPQSNVLGVSGEVGSVAK